MIAQYTQAAIAPELKRLAHRHRSTRIPSSAMQEDHVDGWAAARAAAGDRRPHQVLVVEPPPQLAASSREPAGPPPASPAAIAAPTCRRTATGADRWLAPEIEIAVGMINSAVVAPG
jgi:histidine ammonia-lyase